MTTQQTVTNSIPQPFLPAWAVAGWTVGGWIIAHAVVFEDADGVYHVGPISESGYGPLTTHDTGEAALEAAAAFSR